MWAILAVISALAITITACDGADPDGEPPTQEDIVELDLSGGKGCEVAGHQEMIAFVEENSMEVYNETLDEDGADICIIALIWSVTSGGEPEQRTMFSFGLRIFDSVDEAEAAIEAPGRVQLTAPEDRDPSVGVEMEAPSPWEEGFIWSTPDSSVSGQTEVAARTSNIVLWVDFSTYPVDSPDRCDGEGERCGVLPSELVEWLHDEYLPAVGARVNDLAE
jgi:hypothetical protein